MMQKLFLYMLTVSFVWGFSANAAEPNCDTPSADIESLKDLHQVQDKIETSPFVVACKEPPGLLQGRPETGLFVRSVVEKDSKGKTTEEFLKKVLAKVRQRITETKYQMQNIQTCANSVTPECEELKQWVDKELPQYVGEARYHLSLSQSPHEVKSFISAAATKPNSNLDPLGGYKFVPWAPLTASEEARAQKQLKEYRDEIKQSGGTRSVQHEICRTCRSRFEDDALITVRFQHYEAYHQMLQELPLLQYLKGPKASKNDVNAAFTQMSADLDKESRQLDEYEKMLSQRPLSSDVLKVLNYSSQVEEVLVDDKDSCGLATSLVYTMSNRQMGNAIAIGLPILAVSIFAAPIAVAVGATATVGTVVATTAGAVTGGAMALQSYSEFKETEQRTLGYLYGDELGAELSTLESANRRMKYDVVTLPVGYGLGAMALRSLSVGSKSVSVARKIWPKFNSAKK